MRRYASVLAVLFLAACAGKPPQQQQPHGMPPPPAVGVASPLQRELPIVREITGQVEAVETVELRPRVGGIVDRVLVKNGSEVKAGQAILDIDPKPFEVAMRSAEANLARADVLLAQARQQFDRGHDLLPQHVISQQQFDDLQAAKASAEAQRAVAEAALASARLDLGYAHVTAPIAGRIGKVQATLGNLVQGGGPVPATLIATIVTVDPVDIAFDLDEATWQRIRDRVVAAASDGSPVSASAALTGEPGFKHQGAISYADNQIDAKSGSIRIRARFANPDRSLTPGAFARVRVEIAPARPVLLITEQALQSQLTMRYVLVVGDGGATQIRPVQLGEQVDGGLRVVTAGLGPDERIVVSGLAKVFPGMPISPIPTTMLKPDPEMAPPAGQQAGSAGHAEKPPSAPGQPAAPDSAKGSSAPQPGAGQSGH